MSSVDAGGDEVNGAEAFDLVLRPHGLWEVGQDARAGSRGGEALPGILAGLRERGRRGGGAGWGWWWGGVGLFACGLGKAVLASR